MGNYLHMQINTEQKKVTIIGGGAAGCATAWELAEQGLLVDILEYREELLEGSSDDTPCRLGLGFHYIDIPTAIKYLQATIGFVKKYPEFIIAGDQPNSHPYRRGRYIVVKDSVFTFSQIQSVYEALKSEYRRLVDEDPSNKVFGDPENFYRFLTLNEYKDDINPDIVLAGIETAEQILDWPRFKKFYSQKIKSHPNIKIHNNIEVARITHDQEETGFTIHAQSTKDQTPVKFQTNSLVNSAWESIEALSKTAGFSPSEGVIRTNRLKVIIEVTLPPDFESEQHLVNSLFFCFGPHAAFTNVSKGRGYISYEPLTNIGMSTAVELPESFKKIMYAHISDDEKFVIAEKIHRAENVSNIITYYLSIADEESKKLLLSKFEKINDLLDLDLLPQIFEDQANIIKDEMVKLLLMQVETFLAKLDEPEKTKLFDEIEEKGVFAKDESTKQLSLIFNDYLSKLPEEQRFELSDKINLGIIENYPQRMIEKVARYIPKMATAKYVKAKFGIVKTHGPSAANIYSKDSQVHKRNDYHIKENMLGLSENPSMKLLYLFENAKINKQLISDQITIMDGLETITVKAPLSIDNDASCNNNAENKQDGYSSSNEQQIDNNYLSSSTTTIKKAIVKDLHLGLRAEARNPKGEVIRTAQHIDEIVSTVEHVVENQSRLLSEFKEHCSNSSPEIFPKPKVDYRSGFFRRPQGASMVADLPKLAKSRSKEHDQDQNPNYVTRSVSY